MAPEEFLIPHQNPKWENSANRKPRARAQEERILSVMRYVKILNVCICFSAFLIMMSTMAIICNENHSHDSKPHWGHKWGSCSSNVRTRPNIPKTNWCHQSRARLICHDFGLQSATHQQQLLLFCSIFLEQILTRKRTKKEPQQKIPPYSSINLRTTPWSTHHLWTNTYEKH
jgi:hypothetical protein